MNGRDISQSGEKIGSEILYIFLVKLHGSFLSSQTKLNEAWKASRPLPMGLPSMMFDTTYPNFYALSAHS